VLHQQLRDLLQRRLRRDADDVRSMRHCVPGIHRVRRSSPFAVPENQEGTPPWFAASSPGRRWLFIIV
jgi:hypothetical protein